MGDKTAQHKVDRYQSHGLVQGGGVARWGVSLIYTAVPYVRTGTNERNFKGGTSFILYDLPVRRPEHEACLYYSNNQYYTSGVSGLKQRARMEGRQSSNVNDTSGRMSFV